MLYFVKTPHIIKRMFPKLIWNIPTKDKTIYLTFDDGPTPEITNWVLNQLSHYNAKATFFCIGKNIANHPDILKNIIQNGHTIGNHTNHHLNNWKVSSKTYVKDVEQTHEILKQQIGANTNQLFRPPYGKIKLKTTKKLQKKGFKIIMWDVLSADFDQSITTKKCLDNILKNTTNGSIIVCHDSVKAFENLKYVLPKTLAYFSEKGFVFKKLPA
jgi:peptidoglycan/xylan/chitin deacetylase (PgdA/CDA1 family)